MSKTPFVYVIFCILHWLVKLIGHTLLLITHNHSFIWLTIHVGHCRYYLHKQVLPGTYKTLYDYFLEAGY
jgi:hypothetical protein